jgi:SAM-dependent methyltransferase
MGDGGDAMSTTSDGAGPTLAQRFNAAIYEPFLWLGERAGMAERRRRVLAGATGRVIELGAGTGLNLDHYPTAVDDLVLTEPDEGMSRRLEARVRESSRTAEVVHAPAEELPFEDHSFDTAVSTLVLCTVEDPERAVSELRRVLRPGGRFLFIEHVRSDSPRLARWQDRLEEPWAAFAEGCRCNRRTLDLLESSLAVKRVEQDAWRRMPLILKPLVVGEASA